MNPKFGKFFPIIFLLPLVFNPSGFDIFELPKVFFLVIFLAVAGLFIFSSFLKQGKLALIWEKKVAIFFGLWLLSLVLSTIFSEAPLTSFWGRYERWQGLFTHLFYLLYFVVALHALKSDAGQQKAMRVIFWTAFAVSVFALFQKAGISLFQGPDTYRFLGRVFSTIGHPNFLGQFLLFPLWIGGYLFWNEKKIARKWMYGSSTFLVFVTFFFAENRASMLGLAVSIFVAVLLVKRLSLGKRIFLSVSGVLALSLFLFFIAPSTRSLQSRLHLWQGIPNLVQERFFIGHGLETFKNVAQKNLSPKLLQYESFYDVPDRSHNEVFDILVMQGALGAVLYIVVLFYLFIYAGRKDRLRELPVGASYFSLVAIFVSVLFSFSVSINWLVLFTIISILLINTRKFTAVTVRLKPASFLIACFLVIALGVASFISFQHLKGDAFFKKGLDAYYERRIDDSFEFLGKALELNPHQDDLFFTTANVYYTVASATGNPLFLSEAARFLEGAGKFSNYNFRYYIELGRVKTAQKNFDEANELYKKAYILAPVNPVLSKDWGFSRYYAKDYVKAAATFEEFLKLAPPYWTWTPNLNAKSAEEKYAYDLFMRLTPDFMDVFPPLARSYAELGNREKVLYYIQFIPDQKTRENILGFL